MFFYVFVGRKKIDHLISTYTFNFQITLITNFVIIRNNLFNFQVISAFELEFFFTSLQRFQLSTHLTDINSFYLQLLWLSKNHLSVRIIYF